MNIFVSLDGVDGVGKTTVARLLENKHGFQYHKSPSGPFADFRGEIDRQAGPIDRYCFYRMAVHYDSVRIGRMLVDGPVIADRYIASTFAYHLAMEPRINEIHHEDGLLQPDFSFLLSAKTEVREKRLRDARGTDMRFESDTLLLDRVASIFLSFGLHEVETSDKTPEEVTRSVLRVIRKG